LSLRKTDKKPYVGVLAEPMPKFTALTQPSEQELDALIETKWKALFAHYEIEAAEAFNIGPNLASIWMSIAWALARDHVPGFRPPPRWRGALARRKADDVTLVLYVELLKRGDNLSEREATKRIANEKLVAGTPDALRERYKHAKKTFAPLTRMFDGIIDTIRS